MAARYPPMKEEVRKRAMQDLTAALKDVQLRVWAPHDPALRVLALDDKQWKRLEVGKKPASAANQPAAVA